MLTTIKGIIKCEGNNQKIQLIISGSDHQKFEEYKNIDENGKVIEGYCTMFRNHENEVISAIISKDGDFYITSVKNDGDGKGESDKQFTSNIEEIKTNLGITSKNQQQEVELFKHIKMIKYENHLKSLPDRAKTLEDVTTALDLEENFKKRAECIKGQVQPQEIKVGDNLQEKMNSLKSLHNDIIDELKKEIQGKIDTLANASDVESEGGKKALTEIESLKFEDGQDIEGLQEKMNKFFELGIVI